MKKQTNECYNWDCQNFIKEDGTEFEFSPDAYGSLGKCKFKRDISKLMVCGMFVKRKEKLHTELEVVKMALSIKV